MRQDHSAPRSTVAPSPASFDLRGQSAAAEQPSSSLSSPSISLPKGGGAIKGIGEKFGANPVTGTGSMSVPIATSPGRSGFGPQLTLSYDSGAGNGPFGFGWSLSLPSITRKTDKGLPRYLDDADSDVFILSGAEDLVPTFRQDLDGTWLAAHPTHQRDSNGSWVRDASGRLLVHEDVVDGYRVRRYRPRIEGLFARIERWTKIASPEDVHWRSISKDNILTLYGADANSRIVDADDASRIFSWLICESRDDRGNGIRYRYKAEDGDVRIRSGQPDPRGSAHQRNRGGANDLRRATQRYLHRIFYGNRRALLDDKGQRPRWISDLSTPPADQASDWLFEVRFDYGELDEQDPTGKPEQTWLYRPDAFSSYRSGFEVRTCRLCERVFMLHHFPDPPAVGMPPGPLGYDGVVRSTEFTYDFELDPSLSSQPVYSFLARVIQAGWVQGAGVPTRRALPPVSFSYSKAQVQDVIRDVDRDSLDNLPVGLDGRSYRWVDLHGEGIPGVLTEQAGAWFYKSNWSPIEKEKRSDDKLVAKASLGLLEVVALKPNAGFAAGADFMDLAGDGQPDLVVLEGPLPGLYEHDEAEGWQTFRPFLSRLNRDAGDPNLRFVDLDGDGHADVLITENEAFVWHASLAEEGFGPAQRVVKALDEEKGPRVVFADGTQTIQLADLSGDGLSDIVRIRNGEVCYWPNLGYGRFGAKVTMDNAPWFDHPDQFDHRRIRLADIDGSGTTDIIYLHGDGVRLYFNQSGNSWSQAQTIQAFPPVDDLATVMPVDLLGNGTACLVWSSPLPGHAHRPMRYVNLMGDCKPHLLVESSNNLGAETKVTYVPSTKFYLQDKRDGRPWATRLPFPVHVVECVETYDHISRNRFVTRYAYHHGHFDGEEREFRGFGMVEQWDTAQLAGLSDGEHPVDNAGSDSHVPPVHTKSWFHTGSYLGQDRISRQFETEYFREPGLTVDTARPLLLDDTALPSGLSVDEEREACRALKGAMLRQEVYADDADHAGATPAETRRARTPYTVSEQNFAVRAVQPRGHNPHAIFFTHAFEALSYHYERDPADPRLQHALTLEVDGYGNVLKQASIGYGRRPQIRVLDAQGLPQLIRNLGLDALDAADQPKQTATLLTYTENLFTNEIDTGSSYRTPLPCEAVTFELTGYAPSGPASRFQASDLVEPAPVPGPAGALQLKVTDQVPYESAPTAKPCRRPIEWLRTLYRQNDLEHVLPLRQLHSMALPGQSFKLAFTPGLLAQVFQRPRDGQADEALLPDPAAVLAGHGGERGGYVRSQMLKAAGVFPPTDTDDHWWVPAGQAHFGDASLDAAAELAQARQHFFVVRRYRDPFDQDAEVDFDAHDLLMTETRDALGNRVTVDVNDYRVLQPSLVSDPNRNQTQVAFDALGLVVGTAVMGKPEPAPVEGDSLEGFVGDLAQGDIDAFFAGNPHDTAAELLKGASTRIVYDLDRFRRTREANPDHPHKWQPVCAATLARETHLHGTLPPHGLRIQLSVSYSDGFGREIQKKIQAEKGQVPQRDGDGRIIVDAHGRPLMTPDERSPRWVGSGWTIFNNKGKPIRQYEPFFSDTHGFDFDVRVGVSPVLFYDPADRVVATLHPNHTYEKVVFDPWQQTTYDVNDTTWPPQHAGAAPFDPKDDPHVGPIFRRLPEADYLPTWYDLRTDAAKALAHWPDQSEQGRPLPYNQNRRASEAAAALQAAHHADTPTRAYFDALV